MTKMNLFTLGENGEAERGSNMWQNLPPLALAIVFDSLPLHDKLSASSTCKAWREQLFSPRCLLLENFDVKFPCCSSRSSLDFLMTKKILRQVKSLTLEWNICTSDLVVVLFDILILPNNRLRKIVMKPRLKSYCKKFCRSSVSSDAAVQDSLQKKLKDFVLRSKCLESLSLGYSFTFCESFKSTVIDMLKGKELLQKIEHLNFAGVGAAHSESPSMINLAACLGKSLTRLSITWDYNLESSLNCILTGCPRLWELDLTAETSLDPSTAKLSDEYWKKVKKTMPDLKIGLNILETVHQEVSFPFTDLLTSAIPVKKYEIIFQNTMFAIAVLDKALLFYLDDVERIGIHYVEKYRDCSIDQFFIMYLFSKLTVLDCRKLKELCLSGYYITDGSVMQFLTRSGVCPQLEKFLVSKHDIVSQSQNSPYFVKLSSAQVYGLERAVSVSWGKDWKALNDLPAQRKIKYKQENIPEIIQYVLQDHVF